MSNQRLKTYRSRIDITDDGVETENETIHDVIIIDPDKVVQAIFSYPPSVGMSPQEVLRVLDALQTPDQSVYPSYPHAILILGYADAYETVLLHLPAGTLATKSLLTMPLIWMRLTYASILLPSVLPSPIEALCSVKDKEYIHRTDIVHSPSSTRWILMWMDFTSLTSKLLRSKPSLSVY